MSNKTSEITIKGIPFPDAATAEYSLEYWRKTNAISEKLYKESMQELIEQQYDQNILRQAQMYEDLMFGRLDLENQ